MSMLLIWIEIKPYLIYSSEYNRFFFPDAIMSKDSIFQNKNVQKVPTSYLYLSPKYDVYIKTLMNT